MHPVLRISFLFIVMSLLPVILFGNTQADEWDDRRVSVGFKLFPSLLAADKNIKNKQGADGKLLLLIVYTDDQKNAESLAKNLRAKGSVRKISLNVQITNLKSLPKFKQQKITGLFLSQRINNGIDNLISFGLEKRAIVFSPFEGDVAKGVSGGLFVTDRVQPYLNVKALKSAKIHLKSFFLRVAKHYDK
jgi:hypothetical protein